MINLHSLNLLNLIINYESNSRKEKRQQSEKADYALVYSRDTGEIWNIDSRHNKLNKIDLPYEYLNYLYTDNGKILISSDNTVYGELDSFLTKK